MKTQYSKSINFFLKAFGFVFILFIILAYSNNDTLLTAYEAIKPLPQVIKPVPIEKDYTFAGEEIPMENFDLMERMDRELIVNSYRHSATIQYIKLANRYFPTIERILKKNNIPDDFKYLAVAESGLRNVVSPSKAKGFWQFMRPIAEELNLEIYEEVDERYHLEKSTQAACEYLNKLHKRFGNWINAAAAYNVGPTNLRRYLNEQNQDHYFDLNINEETMRYIFRITALKEILQKPEDYGFQIPRKERYPVLNNFYTIKIDTTINNLGAFAKKQGTSYRMLKIYNPWLRDTKLTVKNNTYFIKIPKAPSTKR